MEDIVRFYEEEIGRAEASIRRELENGLKSVIEKGRKVFLCRDRSRVYLSKPRSCDEYDVVDPREYIEREIVRRTSHKRLMLKAWRWIMENCRDKVPSNAVFYRSSGMMHFDNGYLYVTGISEPIIIMVIDKMDPFIKCIQESPFKKEILPLKEK